MTAAAQFWLLQTALPAIGLALLIGGFHLAQPLLVDGGLLALAAAAALSGLGCIAWRRVVYLQRTLSFGFALVVHHGIAALFVGAALVALGLTIAAAGAAHLGGMSAAAIRAAIVARPGLVLAPLGFILLAIGVALLIGFAEDGAPGGSARWKLLASLPDRLGGAILSVLGAAALAAGAYELLDPQAFDQAVDLFKRGWPA